MMPGETNKIKKIKEEQAKEIQNLKEMQTAQLAQISQMLQENNATLITQLSANQPRPSNSPDLMTSLDNRIQLIEQSLASITATLSQLPLLQQTYQTPMQAMQNQQFNQPPFMPQTMLSYPPPSQMYQANRPPSHSPPSVSERLAQRPCLSTPPVPSPTSSQDQGSGESA